MRTAVSVIAELKARKLLPVAHLVAVAHATTVRQMFDGKRYDARARFEFWACLASMGWTASAVARLCGVDHTSVLYGVRKVKRHERMPACGVVGASCV